MNSSTPTPGKVFLIGAGPGDPELLTLKAVRVLGQCDVLLIDDLVDPAVLVHARKDARVVASASAAAAAARRRPSSNA
jgi:uroporphyrin-III C-methyltransferase